MEDGPLQELLAQHSGGPGGPHPGTGATLDPSVPRAEVKTVVKDLVINILMLLWRKNCSIYKAEGGGNILRK